MSEQTNELVPPKSGKWIAAGVAALITIAALVFEWFYAPRVATNPNFNYALDDPYIHLAMARNFLQHGVWGTDPHVSVSASSSPLWILLLIGGFIVRGQADEMLPLYYNAGLSVALSVLLGFLVLRSTNLKPTLAGLVGGIVGLCVPVVTLTFIGMEHTLHTLLAVCFLLFLERVHSREKGSTRDAVLAFVFAFLIQLVRFESAFIMVFPMIYFIRRKQIGLGLSFFGGSLAAVGAFGLFSISKGMNFFPNSLVIKAFESRSGFDLVAQYLGAKLFKQLVEQPVNLWILVFLGLILFAARKETHTKLFLLAGTVFSASLLHGMFANYNWFFRYDAYLLTAFTAVAILYWKDIVRLTQIPRVPFQSAAGLALGLSVFFFGTRAMIANMNVAFAMQDIGTQQYNMTQFVKTYYNGSTIMANDIGMLSWYTDAKIIDLYGLSNDKVRKLKRAGDYTKQSVSALADEENVELIVCYADWFIRDGSGPKEFRGSPDDWIRVEDWRFDNVVVSGGLSINFFARNKAKADELATNLEGYDSFLPRSYVMVLNAKTAAAQQKRP